MKRQTSKILFQMLIVSLLTLSVTTSLFFLFSVSNSVTGESDFYQSRNRIYTTDTLTGRIVEPDAGGISMRSHQVLPGSLLLQINTKEISDSYELEAELNRFRDDNQLLVWFLEPSLGVAQEVLVQKGQLNDSTLASFQNALIILQVEEGGVSDRAGIKKGDIILSINDREISSELQARNEIKNLSPGSIAKYEIIRGSNKFNVNVQLAKYGINIITFALFLGAMISFVIGGIIGIKRPSVMAARLSSLAIIGIGNFLVLQQDIPQIDAYLGAQLLVIYLLFSFFTVAPILLHSTYYFPNQNLSIIKLRWPVYVPYILMLLTLMAVFATFAVDTARGETADSQAKVFYIISLFTLITMVFGIFVHVLFRPRQKPKVTARSLKLVILLVPPTFIVTQLLSFDIGELNRLFVLILLVIPVAYLYTIAKFRLLDIDFRIRKNVQYGIVSIAWNVGMAFFFVAILYFISQIEFYIPNLRFTGSEIEVMESDTINPNQIFWGRIIATALTLLLIWATFRIYKWGEVFISRKFHRTNLDSAQIAEELSSLFAGEHNFNISSMIPVKTMDLMKLFGAGFIGVDGTSVNTTFFTDAADDVIRTEIRGREMEFLGLISEFEAPFRTDYLHLQLPYLKENFPFGSPLYLSGKLVGVIFTGRKLSESKYKDSDIEILEQITHQASLALEKELLYKEVASRERVHQEIELARRIQVSSLPKTMPEIEGLDIFGLSNPAYEVGGDFFEFGRHSDTLISIILGDVKGKGTSAAMYMSKAQGIIATLNEYETDPRDFFIKFNKLLIPYLQKGDYLTCIGTFFDTSARRLLYARAGHLPLLYFDSANDGITNITSRGLGIGLSGGEIFDRNLEKIDITYNPGDIFLLLSDGVVESRNSLGKEFGDEKIHDTLRRSHAKTSKEIAFDLMAELRYHMAGSDQFDDITICVVKATGTIQ